MTRTPRRWLAAIGVASALVAAPAWAARPLDTEDTETLEPGKAELQLSGDFTRGSGDNLWGAGGVLSLGLLPRLEGRVESALLLFEPEGERARGRIGDTLFGFKYRILDEAVSFPAVLAQLTLTLPTGDGALGLGPGGVDVGLLAAVSKTFGPIRLTWNGGYTFVTQDRNLDFWRLSASVEYLASKAWLLVGEVVSALAAEKTAEFAVLRVGAVYAISERIRLDGAVGFGLTRPSPDVILTVGVTISLF